MYTYCEMTRLGKSVTLCGLSGKRAFRLYIEGILLEKKCWLEWERV